MSMVEDRHRSDYQRETHQDGASGRDTADPLTELARLIGQGDPYADLKGRRASLSLDPSQDDTREAPGWLSRPAAPRDDDPQDDAHAHAPARRYTDPAPDYRPAALQQDDAGTHAEYAAYEDDRSHDQYAEEPHHDGAPRYQAGQYAEDRYADDPQYDGEPRQDDYDDRYHITAPTSDEYYDGHLPPRGEGDNPLTSRRRGGLITVAAVLGLAVIGTAGAFGYRAFTGGPSSDAAAPVIKADAAPVKSPPPTSSAETPDNSAQARLGTPGTVQTERIVSREETPVAQPAPAWPAPPRPGSGVSAAQPLPQTAAAPTPTAEPKRVKTLTIRPDGDSTQSVQPAAKAAPARKTAAAPTTGSDVSGGYVVQLSAQKSEAEAKDSYRALQAKYPSVLGGREPNIHRADTSKGVYYRVQLGPFSTAQAAGAFCDELKSAGGQCIVPPKNN